MLSIFDADLHNPQHAAAIVQLLDAYACDPMGGRQALSAYCKANLIAELKKRDSVQVVLAFVDQQPAGLAICIEGFSTFACQPLLNIHDFAVTGAFRGQGIARKLLDHIEQLARQRGCCKITLEVLSGNQAARALYTDVGFGSYELDPALGGAIMLQKKLTPVSG